MRIAIGLLAMVVGFAAPTSAQSDRNPWRVYTPQGQVVSIDAIVERAADADVVLVGELHDDTLGHRFKQELLRELDEKLQRPVALSMEMFERDVQLVVDEYFGGMISETHFRASSRPWPDYERDYRPLVEYAREGGIALIAANPPRRYVNLVAREGLDGLSRLYAESKSFLPSLPVPEASDAYRETFFERMSGMMGHGNGPDPQNLFDAQRLWDAGMADAIVRYIERSEGVLVMHVAGGFHIEQDTGIPDMLRAYRSTLDVVSVAVRPGDAFDADEHGSLGDVIVLTAMPK